jgi:heme/copper-type cytochrome/quinol oxidase subunit 2
MALAAGVPDTHQKFWHLIDIYAPIGGGVFLIIVLLLIGVGLRFRSRADEYPQGRHEWPLMEYSYAGLVACVVGFLLYITFNTMWSEKESSATAAGAHPDTPPGALTVKVVGAQWSWQFIYPRGVQVAGDSNHWPTLRVPVGRPVHFVVTSTDVIHSFWVTDRAFKVDAFPRRITTANLIWPKPGYWPEGGRCNQFCGLDHTRMNFNVRAMPISQFNTWLTSQKGSA